jgi:hypothetical protein
MIEHRGREGTWNVTDTAILICYNVVRLGVFAGRIGAIVAGIASVTHNIRASVIDKRIGKICRVMAYGAIRVRVLMNWRNGHPPGTKSNIIGAAIMARRAITGDTDMAKNRWSERGICMAVVTILIRR